MSEMMQLDDLHIKSFRGLKDFKLLDLGSLNILVGNNNSGKTSVLEAGSLFLNPLNFYELYRIAVQRETMQAGPRVSRLERLHRIKWLFPHFKETEHENVSCIEILSNGRTPFVHYKAQLEEVVGIPEVESKSETGLDEDEFDIDSIESEEKGLRISLCCQENGTFLGENEVSKTFWDIREVLKSRLSSVVVSSVNSTFVEPHGHRIYGVYKSLYSRIYRMNAHQDLISLLQHYDQNVTGLVILEDDVSTTLHVEHKVVGIAPISIFGDGLRRVLYIAMRLISAKDGVCFLDEIDNAIHVSALDKTAEWIVQTAKQLNVQLFITTHNLEALDAFISTSGREELVAYHIEDCGSKCRRYDGAMLHALRYDRGLDVR